MSATPVKLNQYFLTAESERGYSRIARTYKSASRASSRASPSHTCGTARARASSDAWPVSAAPRDRLSPPNEHERRGNTAEAERDAPDRALMVIAEDPEHDQRHKGRDDEAAGDQRCLTSQVRTPSQSRCSSRERTTAAERSWRCQGPRCSRRRRRIRQGTQRRCRCRPLCWVSDRRRAHTHGTYKHSCA